jgi:hypothetical protein
MAGRRVINEQDARRCLAAAKAWRGGLAAWACAHGVDGRSLNCWRVNLKRRSSAGGDALAPRLVEVVPAAMPVTTGRTPYVLYVRGVELEFGDDFEEQSLRRLVGLLKSC